MCLHYGQEVFEGMKAYKTADGRALLFRPEKNMARLNRSNERLCIPLVDEAFCVEALKKLVGIEKDWIPTAEGTSLYLRPFIFAVPLRPPEYALRGMSSARMALVYTSLSSAFSEAFLVFS